MINIVIGIFFILIWLGTSFFIIYNLMRINKNLIYILKNRSGTPKKTGDNFRGQKTENKSPGGPFNFLKFTDPKQVSNIIQREHPQIIALVLAFLEPEKSFAIIRELPCEVQADIISRIAEIDHVDPQICRKIEKILENKLSKLPNEGIILTDGIENTVKILDLIDDTSRNQIMEKIEIEKPELADKMNHRINDFINRKPFSFYRENS